MASALLGGSCGSGVEVILGVPATNGLLPVEIRLAPGQAIAAFDLRLDGTDITSRFSAADGRLIGEVPLPPPGESVLEIGLVPVSASSVVFRSVHRYDFRSPGSAPEIAGFDPDLAFVPPTAWMRLRFESPIASHALDGPAFGVACNGVPVPRALHRDGDSSLIVNPTPELPQGQDCRIAWRGAEGGIVERTFRTQVVESPIRLIHERRYAYPSSPFPDDWFTVEDAGTATGRRVAFADPSFEGPLLTTFRTLAQAAQAFDGFSPVTPIFIRLPDALGWLYYNPIPPWDAIDSFSPIGVYDLDPASPSYGRRVPFRIELRLDYPTFVLPKSFALYPTVELRPGGRYGVVIRRAIHSSALAPSEYVEKLLAPPLAGEDPAVTRGRASLAPFLSFLEDVPDIPIPREDVADAFVFTVGTGIGTSTDLLALRSRSQAAPPVPVQIASIEPWGAGGARVRGTVSLPYFLSDFGALERDSSTGTPRAVGSSTVPFVLNVPAPRGSGPAPLVWYFHDAPGTSEDVTTRPYADPAGTFASIAITSHLGRTFETPLSRLAATLLFMGYGGAMPAFWTQSSAESLYFLRSLLALETLDVVPFGMPDGSPDLDPTRLLVDAVGEGAGDALRILPYVPEVLATTATAGGGRIVEATLHFDPIVTSRIAEGLGVYDSWPALLGLSLFQTAVGGQDAAHHAAKLHRTPVGIAGFADSRRSSLLLLEGEGDPIYPANAMHASASALGLPLVGPVRNPAPTLSRAPSPLQGNLAPFATGGLIQYGPPDADCDATPYDGHACPQRARSAAEQQARFFESALQGGPPEILDGRPFD